LSAVEAHPETFYTFRASGQSYMSMEELFFLQIRGSPADHILWRRRVIRYAASKASGWAFPDNKKVFQTRGTP